MIHLRNKNERIAKMLVFEKEKNPVWKKVTPAGGILPFNQFQGGNSNLSSKVCTTYLGDLCSLKIIVPEKGDHYKRKVVLQLTHRFHVWIIYLH